ncbi:Agglutinin-like protein ALA1, putative isoform 1 [Hibiscus syriacus]|uniref:Agglutinin-like protein ALA1, putative isoform 1 n=1 Tax=Hibiscus syriacus TaxID=106335 RepID=A0A6A3BFT4_HIBSY|nr:Agglutinin-like protein ALA1, putative isoform 1 [Hibiscus syriacus]
MFDWNEEELTNIIWDEDGETDDHIVPYQEGSGNCHSKTKWSRETATIKSSEEKTPVDTVDLHGKKLEGSSSFNADGGIATSGFFMGLWPELSLSNAEKTDKDSIDSKVSNSLVEVAKSSSIDGEMTELSKDPKIFQNPNEGKEQGDFVDYSWANIGSFDDLDRIFSNDDPMFGNVSLGSADGLWSSSKVVTNSPGKSFLTNVDFPNPAPRSTPEHLEVQRGYERQENQSFPLSYGKLDGSTSHGLHNLELRGDKSKSVMEKQTNVKTVGKTGSSKSHPFAEKAVAPNELGHKAYRQKRLLKLRRKTEEIVMSQQRQLLGSDSLQYQHSEEFNRQTALPSYDVSPGQANPSNMFLRMTPQEKIEKLRRRQQMQALLAVQKQRQQFTHQVHCTDQPVIQKSTQENQFQHVEDLNTLASFDPNSPLEQNDSSTVSVAIDDYSVEDTVLNQLQEIIAKLDVRTRLRIRDSLFRLAQSAMQRQSSSDTNSTNKIIRDEIEVAKEENKNYIRMSDAETETNPVDRTVAHLLFHRPLELSGKHPETPESPASIKFPSERKSASLMSLPMGCISDNSQVKQNLSHQVSEVPYPLDLQHVEQFKNSPHMDTSENESNYEPAGGGVAEVEASQ